jgi:hypothetical protein
MIWHTQGSGKSLLMAFYARLIVKHQAEGLVPASNRRHPSAAHRSGDAAGRAMSSRPAASEPVPWRGRHVSY